MTRAAQWLINSLVIAIVVAILAAATFACFAFARFTYLGLCLSLLVVVLLLLGVVLIVRDLWKPATRARAFLAIPLSWLPALFLFSMMMQWEGPLYVRMGPGNPLKLQLRGISGVCGLEVYGPEDEKREWTDDDIGLLWSVEADRGRFPIESELTYGTVPSGFRQTHPVNNAPPPPLDAAVTYRLEIGRCMGGPQYLSLCGRSLAESDPGPNVCWGPLGVPERNAPAMVRVDCNTHQPLPMSERAKARLQAYREKRIVYY